MEDITILNPWWKNKEEIKYDKHILDFQHKKYQWHFPLLETLVLDADNIYTLLGPRQIGKTTLMKLLIQKLLQSVPAEAVFFWNCDDLVDFRELEARIRTYLQQVKHLSLGKKFLFLDEVSRVKQWQRAIKFLVDSGDLKSCCVVVTGSHILDLKYGAERLPGRVGKEGKEIFLFPLSFSEYVTLVAPHIPRQEWALTDSLDKGEKKIMQFMPWRDEIRMLFQKYLVTGGFPLAINEYFSQGKIPDWVMDTYYNWIVGDIVKWGKQEKILMQLLRSLLIKQGTAISWDSFAKDAEIKSHKTVASYMELLEQMFAVHVLYSFDEAKKLFNYTKNKKVYLTDPFLFHLFQQKLFYKEAEVTPALIEAVVVSHLFRKGVIGYWKAKREVDVVVRLKTAVIPVEVKWQKIIAKADYAGLHHFQNGFLLSKDTIAFGKKYQTIPVDLFLLSQ